MFGWVALILSVFVLGTDTEWIKVWEDEFNGNTLNNTDWLYETGCSGNSLANYFFEAFVLIIVINLIHRLG
jgi:hypothetical protein